MARSSILPLTEHEPVDCRQNHGDANDGRGVVQRRPVHGLSRREAEHDSREETPGDGDGVADRAEDAAKAELRLHSKDRAASFDRDRDD